VNNGDNIIKMESSELKETFKKETEVTTVPYTFCSHAIPPAERKNLKVAELALYE
jgi:hypothetical protein